MNILITGGAGFIGSNLVNLLSKNKKYKITIVDNFSKGSINYIKKNNVKIKKGDIKNYKFLKKCFKKIDCVIHLAGSTRVIDSIKDPISNFRENLIGTLNLLSLSKEKKVSNFIFASSGGALLGEKNKISNEHALPSPSSPYGASKVACEAYCMAFSKSYNLDVKCLRFSNVYGPNSWHKESIVATLFKNILNRRDTTIFGDGTQTRDFIYVEDICSGIIKSMNSKYSGVINIGTGKSFSLKYLIKTVKKITNTKLNLKHKNFRKGEIKKSRVDNSKAISLIKFKTSFDFEEGLINTWKWFISYNKK